MSKSPILFSDDEDEGSNQDEELLKKFQAMLQGVPPPSSVTMPKLSVGDMLSKYRENESSYGFQELSTQQMNHKNSVTPFVQYLNSSETSEEIAKLCQKVQSRYIYSETLSSCNIWFDSAVKTRSAKKRSGCRNGFGLSPGSRLSHLARRRQIFSCENLQQLANSERRRHIEIKKLDALKTRSLGKSESVEFEKINSSKRALFLSPEDEGRLNHNATSIKRNLFPSSEKRKFVQDNSKTVEVSKWLSQQNFNVGSAKKRKRLESREGSDSWPRRALTFSEEDSDKSDKSNSRNSKVISEIQLSLHHKSKLLWAVSVTLKEQNMSSKHPQFKTCASALFMICRKNLGKILNSKTEGRTSEKMLNFAREQIGDIFEKLGITKEDLHLENSINVLDVRNEANSPVERSEQTKENSSRGEIRGETLNNENFNDSSEPSNGECQPETVHSGSNEKENIDTRENDNCFT